MKYLSIIFIFLTMLFFNGCSHNTSVEDLPALLTKADITPGGEENTLSLFLYVSKPDLDISITSSGKNNGFTLVEIQNTIKGFEANKIPVDGVEEYISEAKVIQIPVPKPDKKDNSYNTRFVFTNLNENIKIIPIIQVEEISSKTVKNAEQNTKNSFAVATTIDIKNTIHSENKTTAIIAILALCGLIGLILFFHFKKT